jgi:hypothetical protein
MTSERDPSQHCRDLLQRAAERDVSLLFEPEAVAIFADRSMDDLPSATHTHLRDAAAIIDWFEENAPPAFVAELRGKHEARAMAFLTTVWGPQPKSGPKSGPLPLSWLWRGLLLQRRARADA